MRSCDEFEMAVEMRLHGALEADRVSELEAHLGSCASCRAFETLARQTETVMATEAAIRMETVDWDAMRARITSFAQAQFTQSIKRGAVLILLLTPCSLLLTHGEGLRGMVWVGVGNGLAMLAAWSVAKWRLRRVVDNEGHRGELLYQARRDLERRVTATKVALLMPLVVVYTLLLPAMDLPRDALRIAGAVGFLMLVIGIVAHTFFVRRPRLLRELDVVKR